MIWLSNFYVFYVPQYQNQDTEDDSQTDLFLGNPKYNQYTISDILGTPVHIINTEAAYQGYNMFSVTRYNLITEQKDETFFIIDMDGNVIFEQPRNTYSRTEEFINSTTILSCSSYAAWIWNYYTGKKEQLGFVGHHDYEYNEKDDTFFTLSSYITYIGPDRYKFDKIIEFKKDGTIVWSVDTRDFIPLSYYCPYKDTLSGVYEVTHSNTIFYDQTEDVIYLNARNTNTVFKIDHTTGSVIWAVGEHGDFEQFDISGNPIHSLFYHGHALEKVDDDTFIIFDNDFHNQDNATSQQTRILEFKINETTMQANITWEWIAPLSYYSGYWGDADRLPNGDRLGTFGVVEHPTGNYSARLVEVDNEGNIVWELSFPRDSQYEYGIYRMDRIRFAPILDSPEDLVTGYNQNSNVTWQTRYNTRQKKEMTGEYTLYANGTPIDTGNVTYAPFWHSTNLSFQVDEVGVGVWNLTLAVSDEGNHWTTDSMNLTVTGFKLEREGPTTYESGNKESIMRWYGGTSQELFCNITLNGTLYDEFTWNGTDITIDLPLLEIGRHLLEINLFNNSEAVFSDDVWVEIFPSIPPRFEYTPNNQSVQWNQTAYISWKIFDENPNDWQLYLNGTLLESSSWSLQSTTVNWTLMGLEIGIYNLTLMISDLSGKTNRDSIRIQITPPSPPIIRPQFDATSLKWGDANISFSWEIIGGEKWEFWRNGTLICSGAINSTILTTPILNWYEEGWKLGHYNLTLVVSDKENCSSHSFWLNVILDIGDAYADDVVESLSMFSTGRENAVGAPDNISALIYSDYSDGFITLDMGENEEIIDGEGMDLSVVAFGDNYSIYVMSDLESSLYLIGHGNGIKEFDLTGSGINEVRYIRIQFYSGSIVQLDAIVAINYNTPDADTQKPEINPLGDIEIDTSEQSVLLVWNATDETPWNYEIVVNGITQISDYWNGSSISYQCTLSGEGPWTVTLTVQDLFGNSASDSIMITKYHSTISESISQTSETQTTKSESNSTPTGAVNGQLLQIIFGFGVIGVVFISIIIFILNRRKSISGS